MVALRLFKAKFGIFLPFLFGPKGEEIQSISSFTAPTLRRILDLERRKEMEECSFQAPHRALIYKKQDFFLIQDKNKIF